MASYGFHKAFYKVLSPIACLFLKTKFKLEIPEDPDIPDTCLLVCNHVTNYDPFVAGLICRKHMYFVATEHIFSLGWKSKLIKTLMDPIPRPKGGNAAGAVVEILRRLKDGKSVALFPEGNCSWDGVTAGFPESTGKMVRSAKVPLVTFRLEGGYFTYPRWAYSFRKGRFTGHVVHVYQPEELRAMKPEEINRHMAEDIFEDAYARLEETGDKYPGKALAKGIEHALVLCPSCRSFGSIRSEGDSFRCSCGLCGSFDERGRLSGEGFSFTTIKEWNAWQKETVDATVKADLAEGAAETEYTHDDDMILRLIEGRKRTETARGRLSISSRSFTLGSFSVPLDELADLTIRNHGIISFSLKDGRYFEIKSADGSNYSGRKYKLVYEAFEEAEKASV